MWGKNIRKTELKNFTYFTGQKLEQHNINSILDERLNVNNALWRINLYCNRGTFPNKPCIIILNQPERVKFAKLTFSYKFDVNGCPVQQQQKQQQRKLFIVRPRFGHRIQIIGLKRIKSEV